MAEQRVVDAIVDGYSFATPDATDLQIREGYDTSMGRVPLPERVTREESVVAGVPGEWFRPANGSGAVVLFLHGGGYRYGSSRSHGPLAAHVAAAAGVDVFAANYRLAPEHPYPAAVEDALAALKELVFSGPGAGKVAVVGDSAGGGLALATLLAARSDDVPMPAAAVTMSAWTDCTVSGDSIKARAGIDPMVTKEQLEQNVVEYLPVGSPLDPLASPVFGDYRDFCPLLMQVGSEEVLFDDTTRIADAVRAAGGDVTVEVQEGMPHVHQILLWALPEAGQAVDRIGEFLRSHLA